MKLKPRNWHKATTVQKYTRPQQFKYTQDNDKRAATHSSDSFPVMALMHDDLHSNQYAVSAYCFAPRRLQDGSSIQASDRPIRHRSRSVPVRPSVINTQGYSTVASLMAKITKPECRARKTMALSKSEGSLPRLKRTIGKSSSEGKRGAKPRARVPPPGSSQPMA